MGLVNIVVPVSAENYRQLPKNKLFGSCWCTDKYTASVHAACSTGARNCQMVQADLKEQPHGHPGAEIYTQCCWWRPCRSSGIACQSQFKLLFCVVNYWRVTTPLLQELGGNATLIFYGTEEAKEGKNAYMERRRPDFSKFPRKPWVSVWFCNDPFNCFTECFSPTWKSEKVWSQK